jgi:hypothetical protein
MLYYCVRITLRCERSRAFWTKAPVLAQQQKGKHPRINRSRTLRTNAQVIVVTAQQQKENTHPGMNRWGTVRTNAQVIVVAAQQQKENLPRDEPLRDISKKCTIHCGYGTPAKREPTQGWPVEGHPEQMHKSLWLRHNSKKETMDTWSALRHCSMTDLHQFLIVIDTPPPPLAGI